MTEKQIARVECAVSRHNQAVTRRFLKQKVGRQLIAILFGKPDKPNFSRADSYLYKGARLRNGEILKVEVCYLAARIIDELRKHENGVDEKVARNWLMLPCLHLEDQAPICAIRDGRSYNHLSAIGAAKTFVLWRK